MAEERGRTADGEATRAVADVVVVAAGSSSRMAGLDKLTAPIGGRPLLAWTLSRLAAAPTVRRIVLVVAPGRLAELSAASWLDSAAVPIRVVAGGTRRQESVAAGVDALDAPDDRVVLVHDGARPAVGVDLVEAIADAVTRHGAAIPVLPVAETIKRVADGVVRETVDRSDLATAQTPQGARAGLLRRAWAEFPPDGPTTFTDEAALLEAARIAVHAIPGDPMNLKVTVPDDLARAASALAVDDAPSAGVRVGTGRDSHPFGPGDSLALGGIVIVGGPRLHGHSDGDVALHAVADALLGAAGLGDLGRLFPPSATPAGISSAELLAEVVDRLRAAGYTPSSIDLTIVGSRPRLAGRLDEMRDAIAAIAGIEPDRVDVKASTGNLAGMEGAGRGMSAQAVAVVVPRAAGDAG
ncbi:MAG TPA: 2-C-methyl-D-erythritol 4-phosphate cytidylyltransferase [Candidatus Binatia bacterium]|nr:2-C-methyl-D-erythritol 4-phosphate cytidylyltransferase [Candidatus Binatia bacterium]